MKFLWALPASLLLLSIGFAQSQPSASGDGGTVTGTMNVGIQGGDSTQGLKGAFFSTDTVHEVGHPSVAGTAQCLRKARISYPTMGFGTITPNIMRAISVVGVNGAPFSADAISEVTGEWPAGRRIDELVHGKTFRDSQGRMRWESEFIRNGHILRSVVVEDPVEGRMIELDENTRVACVSPHWRASDIFPTPKLPDYGDSSEEELGTKQMEGFTTIGTRQTRQFPAGARGYDQPWTSMTEFWFSPELKMTLVSKVESPMAKYTTQLINLRAGEPDPSLFQIPADYTVRDNRQQNK